MATWTGYPAIDLVTILLELSWRLSVWLLTLLDSFLKRNTAYLWDFLQFPGHLMAAVHLLLIIHQDAQNSNHYQQSMHLYRGQRRRSHIRCFQASMNKALHSSSFQISRLKHCVRVHVSKHDTHTCTQTRMCAHTHRETHKIKTVEEFLSHKNDHSEC